MTPPRHPPRGSRRRARASRSPRPTSRRSAPSRRARAWRVATFAGGCFWCVEPPFDKVAGRRLDDLRLHRRHGGRRRPTSRSAWAAPATPRRCGSSTTRRRSATTSSSRSTGTTSTRSTPRASSATTASPTAPAIFVHDEEQRRLAEASKAALEQPRPLQAADRDRDRAGRGRSDRPRTTTRTTT